MTSQQRLLPHIHHEQQEHGSMLCAQHALNALLQGNYYDPSQLADIANELDGLESTHLGLTAHDIANRDRNSLNMDDTGFFSVSVLERALQVWGLTLQSWRSEAMRSRQAQPEKERAFVLNLDSHWFTIRAFGASGNFWFNLNSFLSEPSWVGPNYLGTLLHSAETEGYSVFVVHASEGNIGDSLQNSDADQIADLLPPPGPASSSSQAVLGLKPQGSTASSSVLPVGSGSTSAPIRQPPAMSDEDIELQAALRASLADHGASSSSTGIAVKDNRRRGRSGSATGTDSMDDAEIDAIAPNRRRPRAGTHHTSGEATASSSWASTPPNGLVSARSGQRRTGADDEEDELRRAMAASLAETPSTSMARSGSDSADGSVRRLGRRARRIQQGLQASGLSQDDAIEIDDSLDQDDSLLSSSLPHRSPFLSPAMAAANRDNDDVEEILSDDDAIDPFSIPGAPEASSVIGPRADRNYDDEDAQLQAALAASLGDPTAAAKFESTSSAPSRDWPYGDYETEKTPPPADVDRIFKMREEAKRKEREREERRARGEDSPEPEQPGATESSGAKKASGNDDEDDEDDESEAEAEEVSAEEMRRRRLARFG